MPVIFVFGGMLVLMLMRVAAPIGVRIPGQPIGRIELSFRERLRLQRTNVYAIGALLLLGSALGEVHVLLEAVVIVAIVAILAIPARYVLTTDGLAFNRTVFRPWSEFAGYTVSAGRLTLTAHPGMRPFSLLATQARLVSIEKAIANFLPRLSEPAGRDSRWRLGVLGRA